MALKASDIQKKLPEGGKKNCKECGFPTCFAFAMKLAAGAISVHKCTYLSEEIKVELEEALACLLYTSPSPRDLSTSRMPSSA